MNGSRAHESEFHAFVVARSAALLSTAYLLTGDRGHAEDLVQTALTKTYRAWPRIRDVHAVEAYVRRTMVTTYTTWRRRRHWTVERLTADVPDAARAAGPEGLLVDEELWTALDGLAPRQRAVLVLRFAEDLGVEEVAQLLGLPTGTVKSHTARGLAALRAVLRPTAPVTPSTTTTNSTGGAA